jgi:hypothetical protein
LTIIGRNVWDGGVTTGVVVVFIIVCVVVISVFIIVLVVPITVVVVMTDNFVLNPRVIGLIMDRIIVGIHWVAVVTGAGVPGVVIVRVRKRKRFGHGFHPMTMVTLPTGWPLEDLGT